MSVESQQRHDLEKVSLTGGYQERRNGNIIDAEGATVPTDAAVGYAKGCRFIKTDGGVGTTWYVNEGTPASCDFNAI